MLMERMLNMMTRLGDDDDNDNVEKASPVPAAAVVTLEGELTVTSTNTSPTLLVVRIMRGVEMMTKNR